MRSYSSSYESSIDSRGEATKYVASVDDVSSEESRVCLSNGGDVVESNDVYSADAAVRNALTKCDAANVDEWEYGTC